MEKVDPFIDVFAVFVTKISSVYVFCCSLFVLEKQLEMFRFIKDNVDTNMNILKVLGIIMKPTSYLPNERNITNTMSLKDFYNSFLISRLHYFTKV